MLDVMLCVSVQSLSNQISDMVIHLIYKSRVATSGVRNTAYHPCCKEGEHTHHDQHVSKPMCEIQKWLCLLLQAQYLILIFLVEWVIIHLLNVLMVGRMALRAFQARGIAPGAHVCNGASHAHVCLCCAGIGCAGP